MPSAFRNGESGAQRGRGSSHRHTGASREPGVTRSVGGLGASLMSGRDEGGVADQPWKWGPRDGALALTLASPEIPALPGLGEAEWRLPGSGRNRSDG